MRLAFLLALLLAAPIAQAQVKGDCGTIVFPTGAGQTGSDDLTSFSPLFADTAYNATAALLLYPNLLWINRFSEIDWSRSLATAVTTTDDTTFTVTMRPWHWSDGVPVTAADVAYTFGIIKQLGPTWVGYGGGGLPYIVKTLKVLGPSQFQVVTVHPVNAQWFIYNGISGLAPLPEHDWKKYTIDQQFQMQSTPSFFNVVDGPLKLQSIAMGLDAVFVPNPRWEGPKMHFTRLIFKFLQGDGANVQGVESGDTDDSELPTDLFPKYADHKISGLYIVILPQSTYENVINLNFNNPRASFFHDLRVRQAMEDAIDQQAIIHGLQHGNGDPAFGPVARFQTQFLTPAMRAGQFPVGYDPDKSRALLKAAGYVPGPDGIMQKAGKRLSFTYLEESGTDAITELDEIIQADLRKVGIDMKIQQMEFNQMLALMASHPTGWDATGTGQSAPNYPSGEGSFETGAFQNMGGYSNPELDKLINANISQQGLGPLFAYETYASEQQPVIFTPRERSVLLVNDRIHGMGDFINPAGDYAPDQLYCTPQETAAK